MTGSGDSWSDSALLGTAGDFPGVGADAGLPDIDRFQAGVSRLVGKRLASRARDGLEVAEGIHPAVFLLAPSGPPAAVVDRCSRAPMLDRARDAIEGRIWFVPHVVTVGYWLQPDSGDDDTLFRFVSEEVGLGGTPAVVYDHRGGEPQLRLYVKGLGSPGVVSVIHIAFADVSIQQIFDTIQAVYRTQLVTPGTQHRATRVWSDASRLRAASDAEDVLGGLLSAALQAAFRTCTVLVEQPQPSGRLDIEILERVLSEPGTVRHHAILELKVLRGLNRNGRPVSLQSVNKWISDGVEQAAAYRDERGAREAALCCFDMRQEHAGPQCFAHVTRMATEMDVHLRSWHLFSSASAYRRHLRLTGALTRNLAERQQA